MRDQMSCPTSLQQGQESQLHRTLDSLLTFARVRRRYGLPVGKLSESIEIINTSLQKRSCVSEILRIIGEHMQL
jgi:hypothetical protein